MLQEIVIKKLSGESGKDRREEERKKKREKVEKRKEVETMEEIRKRKIKRHEK